MKVGDLVKWHRYGEESVIGIVLFKEDTGECVVWWSDDCETSEGEKAGELGVEVFCESR